MEQPRVQNICWQNVQAVVFWFEIFEKSYELAYYQNIYIALILAVHF